MRRLSVGYSRFRSKLFSQHSKPIENLARGQRLRTLSIAHPDLHIRQCDPSGLSPGRNVGNLVPQETASGVAATIRTCVSERGLSFRKGGAARRSRLLFREIRWLFPPEVWEITQNGAGHDGAVSSSAPEDKLQVGLAEGLEAVGSEFEVPGAGGLEAVVDVSDVFDAGGFKPVAERLRALLGVDGDAVFPCSAAAKDSVELRP
jgi:hypothetical protein